MLLEEDDQFIIIDLVILNPDTNNQNIINLWIIPHPIRNGLIQDLFLLQYGLLMNLYKKVLEIFTHEFLIVHATLLIHKSI